MENAKSLNQLSFYEILNNDQVECKLYYDKVTNTIEVCDDVMDLQDRVDKEEIIIFPSEDGLYPYGEAMRDYLLENDIIVPHKKTAGRYLSELGCKQDFYDTRDEETKKRLLTWLERYQIPIKVI